MASEASKLIAAIIARGAAPHFKAAGFRKTRLNFERTRGEVVQVVDFQLSAYNFAETGRFFINYGLAVDRIWEAMERRPRPPRLKAFQCPVHHRAEHLVPEAPAQWDVTAATDGDAMAARLAGVVAALIAKLDPARTVADLVTGGWLVEGAHLITRGRIQYAIGNFAAARADIEAAARCFADRQGMTAADLIERHGLVELRGEAGSADPR